MRYAALALVLCVAAAADAPAQMPGYSDPRIQLVNFLADQVIRVEAAIGYQVTIELAPDEQIQTIAVGDTASWSVTTSKASDRLFVKPVQSGAATNMTVVTTARTYNFELAVGTGANAYTIRFRYSPESSSRAIAEGEPVGHYRLSGDEKLWPTGLHDDGDKTFIDWPPNLPLPAVYIVDLMGREVLANGHVRDGIFVIDGIEHQLVFRIDKHIARAFRYIPKRRKP